MPPDPMGNLDQMTTAVHEWFDSYRRSGFRRSEALKLTIVHLKWLLERGAESGDD
jgi:hypothetical protein